MPLKKKFSRKMNATKAKVSKKVKLYVKREISRNIETKFQTYNFGSLRPGEAGGPMILNSPNGSLGCLTSGITQGVDNYNRIGDQVQPVKLTLKLLFQTFSADIPTYNNAYRIIIFQYNRSNVAGAGDSSSVTRNDILYTDADNFDVITAPYDLQNRANYKILYDKTIKGDVYNNQYTPLNITLTRKTLPHTIQWNSAGTTNPAKNKGHVYFLICPFAPGDGTASQSPRVWGQCAFYFKDA